MLIYIQLSFKRGVTLVLLQIPTFCSRAVSTILNLDQKTHFTFPDWREFFSSVTVYPDPHSDQMQALYYFVWG